MVDLPPPTGHVVLDLLMWLVVVILGALEILRRYGFISALGSGDTRRLTKRVSDLEVNEWEERLRHELRDEFDAFMRRSGEYQQRTLDKMEDINLAIREVAAMLRERGRRDDP